MRDGDPANAFRRDDDLERTFVSFFQKRPFRFFIVKIAGGVGKADIAGADDLEAVVKGGSGSEALGAETGAGVIDFEQVDGLAGAVDDDGGYVRGFAADDGKKDEKGCCGKRTHTR